MIRKEEERHREIYIQERCAWRSDCMSNSTPIWSSFGGDPQGIPINIHAKSLLSRIEMLNI